MKFLVTHSGGGYGEWRTPEREYTQGEYKVYDMPRTGEFVEINSLEELAAFVTEAKTEVIINAPGEAKDCWGLEIYNDNRE